MSKVEELIAEAQRLSKAAVKAPRLRVSSELAIGQLSGGRVWLTLYSGPVSITLGYGNALTHDSARGQKYRAKVEKANALLQELFDEFHSMEKP